jgi:translation initiation factor IF-3
VDYAHFLFYRKNTTGGDIAISKELRINEEIRAKEIRVIGADGDQVGILSPREALLLAQQAGLDLVEVAPQAKPPVCRIMDYGKYKFQQSKREKEARKKQKTINVKEVKLRLGIEEHDFEVKARNAIRFLSNGDRVKVTIMFRGREISHSNLGLILCERFSERVKDFGVVDKKPSVEGRNMIMHLSPKQDKKQ